MANFAILDGENVINTIVAESKEIAEQITGKLCIEFSEADRAEVGGKYLNGIFIPNIKPKPYPSWVLNSNYNWEAPSPVPENNPENPKYYIWNEETLSWLEN